MMPAIDAYSIDMFDSDGKWQRTLQVPADSDIDLNKLAEQHPDADRFFVHKLVRFE